MRDPRKSIYIAVLNQGSFRVELTQLMMQLDRNQEFAITFDFPADKPIAHNRGRIVKKFMESGCDYLMMLDGDIIPSIEILDLVKYDADVIGGLCYAYKGEGIIPLALTKTKKYTYKVFEAENAEGLQEVDAIGTGCMIIARRVLENVKAPFVNIYDDDGIRVFGLDMSFCHKAKKKGYRVNVHLDYRCSHWTEQDLKQIYDTFGGDEVVYRPLASRIV